MIFIDLKIILFILLLLLSGCLWILIRYRIRYRKSTPIAEDTVLEALRVSPFGVLILEDVKIVFSNEYARSLLYLSPAIDVLPDSDWLPMLREDCVEARRAEAYNGRYRIVTFASGKTARWWVVPLYHRDIVFLFDITSQIHAQTT